MLFPQTMHAHSQFCMSGDYTLEGTEHAVKELVREEADEHFVIVLSDANLERYGISPDRFAQALTSNSQVHAFAIFIGSLGDQAERWVSFYWHILIYIHTQTHRCCVCWATVTQWYI